MDKKVLIAIGVIAALSIGTYAIIVSRNKTTDESGDKSGTGNTMPPTTKPPKTSNNPLDDSVTNIFNHLSCKYLKINCSK
jgi:ABC-type oligopeptide transport system substrate-binding subunit